MEGKWDGGKGKWKWRENDLTHPLSQIPATPLRVITEIMSNDTHLSNNPASRVQLLCGNMTHTGNM